MAISDYLKQLLVAASYKETLDSILDDDSWTDYDKNGEWFKKEFELDGDKYLIHIYNFTIVDDDGDVFDKVYDIDFSKVVDGKNLVGILNTGHAFQVFGIISQMLEKFLLRNELVSPNGFFFSAKESSRQRLYKRYANIIEKRFGNIYTQVDDCSKFNLFHDYKKGEVFLFMKNDLYKKARLYK